MSNLNDVITVACSKEWGDLLASIIVELNAEGPWQFRSFCYDDDDLVNFTVGRDFRIVLPRSAPLLYRIEDEWETRRGSQNNALFQHRYDFALTPVVFVVAPPALERVHDDDGRIGWRSLLQAVDQGDVRVRHASPRQVDGAAVSIAQWAAFGEHPTETVTRLERGVEEYGPDDSAVLGRAVPEGTWTTDVVIVQEHSAIAAVRNKPGMRGTIVYPCDATLAVPISLAAVADPNRPHEEAAAAVLGRRLENIGVDSLARNGIHKPTDNFTEPGAVSRFAQEQPATVATSLKWESSSSTRVVRLPARQAVRGIGSLAVAAKRGIDICLLVDRSGSMAEADKATKARAAVRDFLKLVNSPTTRVAIIYFSDRAYIDVPLGPVYEALPFDPFIPEGRTALYDAINLGIATLKDSDPTRNRALVGFTDGLEYGSFASRSSVLTCLRDASAVRFYGIAYGDDADLAALTEFADATGGFALYGDPSTIQKLFQNISTYV